MKYFTHTVITLFFLTSLNAQSKLYFKNSKVTAHMIMLINSGGTPEAVAPYRLFLKNAIPPESDYWTYAKQFNDLDWYEKLVLTTDIPQDLPIKYTDVKDRLFKLSMMADDYEEFYFLITGLLSFEEHQLVKNSFEATRTTFEDVYWKKFGKINEAQIEKFEAEQDKLEQWVSKMATFYGNSNQEPLYINIYTIPGSKSATKSFAPRGNISIIGLTENIKDIPGFLGVVLHEIAHELDHSRPMKQYMADQDAYDQIGTFEANIAKYSSGEAIPTVLGNAIAYMDLSGKTYKKEHLYNNPIFAGHAHAIVPLTKEYLKANKTIDHDWVKRSVRLFEATFPNLRRDKQAVLKEIEIFFEEGPGMDRDWISYSMRKQFLDIYSIYDGVRLEDLNDEKPLTKVIYIHHDHERTYAKALEKLNGTFPKELDFSKEYILFDEGQKSPTIIFVMKNSNRLEEIVSQFKQIDLMNTKGGIIYEK